MDGSRLPEGAIPDPLPEVIDEATFTPRLLAVLANLFATTESQTLRRRVGHGTTDYRVLSAIARHPGTTAARIAASSTVDKGEVSRSANALTRAGYIVTRDDGPRGVKHLYLTEAGARLHEQMLPISLRGQLLVERTLTPEEFRQLTELLTRLIDAAADRSTWAPE